MIIDVIEKDYTNYIIKSAEYKAYENYTTILYIKCHDPRADAYRIRNLIDINGTLNFTTLDGGATDEDVIANSDAYIRFKAQSKAEQMLLDYNNWEVNINGDFSIDVESFPMTIMGAVKDQYAYENNR